LCPCLVKLIQTLRLLKLLLLLLGGWGCGIGEVGGRVPARGACCCCCCAAGLGGVALKAVHVPHYACR
jgi:hypothetical protein